MANHWSFLTPLQMHHLNAVILCSEIDEILGVKALANGFSDSSTIEKFSFRAIVTKCTFRFPRSSLEWIRTTLDSISSSVHYPCNSPITESWIGSYAGPRARMCPGYFAVSVLVDDPISSTTCKCLVSH